jgi:hypothetical protein
MAEKSGLKAGEVFSGASTEALRRATISTALAEGVLKARATTTRSVAH